MQNNFWLLVVFLPFISACLRPAGDGDDEDKTFICNSTLTDAATHTPLKDVSLSVYTSYGTLDDWANEALTVLVVDESRTDEKGKSSFEFYNKYTFTSYYLGCSNLPEGYQPYVRVNGNMKYDFVFSHGIFDEQNYHRLAVSNKQSYNVELFPEASYRLTLPTLTPDQKKCKLIIELPVLFGGTTREEYALSNASDINRLKSVRALLAATHATGGFQLKRDTIVKQAYFSVFCTPHDTTEVLLNL